MWDENTKFPPEVDVIPTFDWPLVVSAEVWRLAFICSLVSYLAKEQGMHNARCMGFLYPPRQAFGMQVILITCEFENRDFILMRQLI
jgi:hypothetical protein